MAEALTAARRRRGTVRASITKFEARVKRWEEKDTLSASDHLSIQRDIETLKEYDSEFKKNHFAVVELVDEGELAGEQTTLDIHTDKVTDLLERLIRLLPLPEKVPPRVSATAIAEGLLKRLRYVIKELTSLNNAVDEVKPGPGMDACIVRQLRRQVNGLDSDLMDITHKILSLDTGGEDLMEEKSKVKEILLRVDLKIERLMLDLESSPKVSGTEVGIRLPKISVPTFDGNMLNWTSFWEQFEIAVHSKEGLRDVEKLAYLKDAVKDGPAKHVIEGLSRTAGSYAEAIECLRERYDRPRLIHQAHVRAILEAPSPKSGSGQELRQLHDVVKQHMRALEAMRCDSLETFISSLLELKLDRSSMFAWQNQTKDKKEVPPYADLLEFIDLRARASESISHEGQKRQSQTVSSKGNVHVKTTYATSASINNSCVVCGANKHPLYTCRKFRSLPSPQRVEIARKNQLCYNCLQPGHFKPQCKSDQTCTKCRRPHHTLLHDQFDRDRGNRSSERAGRDRRPSSSSEVDGSSHHTSHLSSPNPGAQRGALLMTCQIAIVTSDGSMTKARALLDCASSTSFVTERLAQRLRLPRRRQRAQIAGIGGDERALSSHSVVNFDIANSKSLDLGRISGPQWKVEAVVLPKITTKLPTFPVSLNSNWKHLKGLRLADPDFGVPGYIDVLLGVDVFNHVVCQGRRMGPPGSPIALNTRFGWVLSGTVNFDSPQEQVISCFSSSLTGDELLQKFWEVENCDFRSPPLTLEEQTVVDHFEKNYRRDDVGRFIVPLPMKEKTDPLGESRTLAVRRFSSLERAMRSKGTLNTFNEAVREYFEQGHAEPVPLGDLSKPCQDVFYLPMHAVCKDTSTTTKLRVVFDASAKSSTGVSLNDQLLVGPTVHAPLIDVLIRFRRYQVAITTDVSKMYRAVLLPKTQRDLHRFVWRRNGRDELRDYRMTRLTFGVSGSSFAANMAIKRNAVLHERSHPRAALAVHESFYVDDGLTGANSIPEATSLQNELQELFELGGFLLRKWKSNEPAVLRHLPSELVDKGSSLELPAEREFTKVLGIEWNTEQDSLRLAPGIFSSGITLTKRALASNVARVYDILGWYSPAVIKIKILLQQLWTLKIGWDDVVPSVVQQTWEKWEQGLPALGEQLIPRCYFPKGIDVTSVQLHGYCDASEVAYGGVVYLRSVAYDKTTHVSLVMAKSKVAPIKTISMPRLELCGAVVLARLLHHCRHVLDIPLSDTFAWTDSTVVLSWLRGNPRRFKPFAGNRVAEIMELVPPERWQHVPGVSNPADCLSRGLYPSELVGYRTWWNGPSWLSGPTSDWPVLPELADKPEPSEEREGFDSLLEVNLLTHPIKLPLLERVSSYERLRRVTAWIRRFVRNCRAKVRNEALELNALTNPELNAAEEQWIATIQQFAFPEELKALQKGKEVLSGRLLAFHPFVDAKGLIRVGGRLEHSNEPFERKHPLILPGEHKFTRLIIRSEHLRLLHAGPTLVAASLARRFAIVGARKAVRDVTRSCVICRRVGGKPRPQLLGQLPPDRLRPGPVFDQVGVDFAGPVLIKSGRIRKPTITKAYVCVFVSFTVKAVHLEPVSELTTSAFIATLRRFVARRGKPSVIWSDHGTNFVGAARELKELHQFSKDQGTKSAITNFCAKQHINWRFTPEHAPHFGGLWEAAVKSFKHHFRRVVGSVRLTFEELTTMLTQVEACLNSRPLTPIPYPEEGLEALTPGHFLTGTPLEALPDPPASFRPIPLLRRWHLCQTLSRHFWNRWSAEYLNVLQNLAKWRRTSPNLKVGDIVCVRGEQTPPTKWPLARIQEVVRGNDGLVRVVVIRTAKGVYKRPIMKIVPLLNGEV